MNFSMLLFSPFQWWAFKDPIHGAQTTLHCSLVDFNLLDGGKFYKELKVKSTTKSAHSIDKQKTLWKISLEKTEFINIT